MPRIDTSDPVSPYIQSVVRFCALPDVSSTRSLYLNVKQGVTVVMTSIDVVNVFGGEGSEITIGIQVASTSTLVSLFGGQTGTGAFDTFSWRGQLAIPTNDSLVVTNIAGAWDVIASGYVTPTVFQP